MVVQDETRNRTKRIPVRCSAAEKELLEHAARRLELSTSEFLRQAGIEKADRDLPDLALAPPDLDVPLPPPVL